MSRAEHKSNFAVMGLSALGIVFGDIGTSPLYTLKTILSMTGGTPPPFVVLGTLSLILWTLIIVTSVKYVGFAMRIDNHRPPKIFFISYVQPRSSSHSSYWRRLPPLSPANQSSPAHFP